MCTPNADARYVVDRLEGESFVLVDDQGHETVERELPVGIHTGDVVRKTPQGWAACPDETAARRVRLRQKKDRLFRRGG